MFALHLARHVVKPALIHASGGAMHGFDTDTAVWLVTGIAAVESEFRALRQHPTGPALGLWQMEPASADDIWTNFLRFRPDLEGRIHAMLAPTHSRDMQLIDNLRYGAAMARLQIWRSPSRLPASVDPAMFAAIWKRDYNTAAGKGTEAKFMQAWTRLVAPAVAEGL